jgi:hypothetical protein
MAMHTKKRNDLMKITTLKAATCAMTLLVLIPFVKADAQTDISPAEARAIAKEAYIYGFPMVDSYRIQYAYFVDAKNPSESNALNPSPGRGEGRNMIRWRRGRDLNSHYAIIFKCALESAYQLLQK